MEKNRNDEIDLSRIVYLITKYEKKLISLAIIGALLGTVLAGVDYLKKERTPRHVITCSFAVVATDSSGNYGANTTTPGYNDVKLAEDIAESVIFVTKSDRVLSSAIEQKHFLGIDFDEIRKYLEVEQYLDTQIVTVKLRWNNVNEGLSIVQSICNVVPNILIETLNLGSVSIVDFPKDTGIEKVNVQWQLIPIAMLLLLGGFIALRFLELLLHPALTDVDSVERELDGLETIGIIPENENYFKAKPFKLTEEEIDIEHYQVQESFIAAAYVVNNLVERENYKCFYVTSSEPGEGKTGVVANLAIELSKREKKVLLIDMDTRRPALGSCFFEKVEHDHSLNAVYNGSVTASEAIISVSDTLDVLPTRLEKERIKIDNILRSELRVLFDDYDIVLLDAPPVGVVSDTVVLNALADKAIMVMKFDTVWIDTIKKNIQKLRKSGIETCGAIITNVNRNFGSGYSAYYRGYNSCKDYYRRTEARPLEKVKAKHRLFKKKNENA